MAKERKHIVVKMYFNAAIAVISFSDSVLYINYFVHKKAPRIMKEKMIFPSMLFRNSQ